MSFAGRAKSALDVTSTIVLTVAAGALAWNLLKSPDATQASSAPRPQVESVSGLRIETAQATNRMGQSPVAIVEFSDYECPFCAQHTRETYPSIQRGLIEPGLVTYVSLAFPYSSQRSEGRRSRGMRGTPGAVLGDAWAAFHFTIGSGGSGLIR